MDTVDELTVTVASSDEWHQIAEWAAAEGWNPGSGDVACFHPTDPAGFFVGRLDGRPVSAISIVNYSPEYAFLGYYLVRPDLRGRGLGMATWRAALPHAGDRTIGLDGVPAQASVYERAGFKAAHRTVRYAGRPRRNGAPAAAVEAVTPGHLEAVAAYDLRCFPARRRPFLTRWLTAEGHSAYALLREDRIAGYGVIRPAREGWRIGPLFADAPEGAEALFDALAFPLGPDDTVALDIPEPRRAAVELATARGLAPASHTVRMYTGPAPERALDRTYGITSLELG